MSSTRDDQPAWLRVAPAHALREGQAARVEFDDQRIAVFRSCGELFAVQADCLHMAGPLDEGDVRDCVITCPWHGWRYELSSGARLDRDGSPLRTYRIREADGWIELSTGPYIGAATMTGART
jgi:nitrite reductase/ring-hydroxylating ferredoxin subunit